MKLEGVARRAYLMNKLHLKLKEASMEISPIIAELLDEYNTDVVLDVNNYENGPVSGHRMFVSEFKTLEL
jgi:hypothetical protein